MMGTIYFLIFVGICAAVIVGFVIRASRQQKIKAQKAKSKAVHYAHQTPHSPVLHSHTRSLKPGSTDMWAEHRQHAAEEKRRSESLIARKIQFDDEKDDDSAEPKMKEFTYTPTEFFENSGRRR